MKQGDLKHGGPVLLIRSAAGHKGTGPDGTGPDGTGPDGTGPDGTGPDGTGPDGTFEGYGCVFGNVEATRETVMTGAFRKSLEHHRSEGRLPALLWQHDPRRPIGIYTDMFEDSKGLFVKGQLALETQVGREAHALLSMGAVSGLSIGFSDIDVDFDARTRTSTLKEAALWEVSLVTFPANSEARIERVRHADQMDGLQSLSGVEECLHEEADYSQHAARALASRIEQLLREERDTRNAKSTI